MSDLHVQKIEVDSRVSPAKVQQADVKIGTTDHTELSNRDAADQHPMRAITGLPAELAEIVRSIPSKLSQLQNDAGYLTGETDPTVPAWAKQSDKPSYTAAEVGAATTAELAAEADRAAQAEEELSRRVDGKQDTIADLESIRAGAAAGSTAVQPDALNGYATEAWVEGKGYLTEEADPTVPDWAKQPTKPSYTASEVHALPDDTEIPPDLSTEVAALQTAVDSQKQEIAKLGDYVTPEMFGAVGDGEAVDFRAIQEAVDTGKTVLLSKKYKCYKLTLPTDKPTNIIGIPGAVLILETAIVRNGSQQLTIENVKIQPKWNMSHNFIDGCLQYIKLTDCEVMGFKIVFNDTIPFQTDTTWNGVISIKNCKIHWNQTFIHSNSNLNHCIFDTCNFLNYFDNFITIEGGQLEDLSFIGCRLEIFHKKMIKATGGPWVTFSPLNMINCYMESVHILDDDYLVPFRGIDGEDVNQRIYFNGTINIIGCWVLVEKTKDGSTALIELSNPDYGNYEVILNIFGCRIGRWYDDFIVGTKSLCGNVFLQTYPSTNREDWGDFSTKPLRDCIKAPNITIYDNRGVTGGYTSYPSGVEIEALSLKGYTFNENHLLNGMIGYKEYGFQLGAIGDYTPVLTPTIFGRLEDFRNKVIPEPCLLLHDTESHKQYTWDGYDWYDCNGQVALSGAPKYLKQHTLRRSADNGIVSLITNYSSMTPRYQTLMHITQNDSIHVLNTMTDLYSVEAQFFNGVSDVYDILVPERDGYSLAANAKANDACFKCESFTNKTYYDADFTIAPQSECLVCVKVIRKGAWAGDTDAKQAKQAITIEVN